MKFWIMIFSAAVFAGGTCLGVALRPRLLPSAPKPPSTEGRDGRRGGPGELSVTRFAHDLGLSEEQDAELDRILEDTHRDNDAYGRAMRAAHDRARDRVTALLTAEQKAKLDTLLAGEQRKRGEGDVKKTVDAYTRILALSPEQAKAMTEALAKARSRRHEQFSAEKKLDREAGRAAWRAIREEQNAEIQKSLSPQQFATYRDIQDLFDR